MTSLFCIMEREGYTWELPVGERYPITILGVGTMGLAVVEHLYQLGLRGIRFIICHADDASLRASPVPVRFLYDAEDPEADQNLADVLKQPLTTSELTILVAELSQPLDCQLASTVGRICAALDVFAIAAIGWSMVTDRHSSNQVSSTLTQLEQQANSLMVYEQAPMALAQRVYQLAEGIINLTTFCDGFVDLDFADMRKVITRPGRIAVTKGAGRGPDRIKAVLDAIVAQLTEQPFDVRLAQRLMLISATATENALLVEEHTALMNELFGLMQHEPTIVRQGIVLDNRLYDQLSLIALLWMPAESAHVVPEDLRS